MHFSSILILRLEGDQREIVQGNCPTREFRRWN